MPFDVSKSLVELEKAIFEACPDVSSNFRLSYTPDVPKANANAAKAAGSASRLASDTDMPSFRRQAGRPKGVVVFVQKRACAPAAAAWARDGRPDRTHPRLSPGPRAPPRQRSLGAAARGPRPQRSARARSRKRTTRAWTATPA